VSGRVSRDGCPDDPASWVRKRDAVASMQTGLRQFAHFVRFVTIRRSVDSSSREVVIGALLVWGMDQSGSYYIKKQFPRIIYRQTTLYFKGFMV
jgi:hypothetical protein